MLIQVLKSDFKDNRFINGQGTMDGCPLIRALIRAGLEPESQRLISTYCSLPPSIRSKVMGMFDNPSTIVSFSFTI